MSKEKTRAPAPPGSDTFVATCRERIRSAGDRLTKPRLEILELLATNSTPLTPQQIFEALNEGERSSSIDRVSVYRTVQYFESLGLIHQVFPSRGYLACRHVTCSREFHVMTTCSRCGRSSEIHAPEEIVRELVGYFEERHGFEMDGHLMQVFGVCGECGGDR